MVDKSMNKAYIGVTVFFLAVVLAGLVFVPHNVFHGMFHNGGSVEKSGPVDVNKFWKALNIGE